MNMYKTLGAILLLLVSLVAVQGARNYGDDLSNLIYIHSVEIDDTEMDNSGIATLDVQRGDEVEVKVSFESSVDLDDVQVEAALYGFEYDAYEPNYERTGLFDVDLNTTYTKRLKLKLSGNIQEDEYVLSVRVATRTGSTYYEYRLKIDVARKSLVIKDVVFTPQDQVVAGRALLATLRLKNDGEKDLNGIRYEVTIPALGVSYANWVDEIEADPARGRDNEVTTEEAYLRIPACAEAGTYPVKVTVTYDEGYEKVTEQSSIEVLKGECDAVSAPVEPVTPVDKTVISIASETQDVVAGESGSLYPVTVTNAGSKAKTYTLTVDGGEGWATFKVTPNTFVLNSGETKTAYLYVSAFSTASAGERMFSLTVSADGSELKQIPLKANVQEGKKAEEPAKKDWGNVTKGLEIALVVLVILLVILGLIIGFSKLRGGNDEGKDEEASGQTYY
ncbi:hypothetical protein HZB01_01720 [Candidatus Woesearchaeota archaeon]|nr:hypothetical protein [Candidatus Woesearchaeota archaeon]